MKYCFHRDTCRLCESSKLVLAVPIKASPIADAYLPEQRRTETQELYPLDLWLCEDCGHVQLLDVVNPKILFSDYIYTTSISLGLVEHFRKYAGEMTRRYAPVLNSLAVDIGSNDGTLLRFFRNQGLRVLGIDPAIEIANRATDSGVKTLSTFFSSELARQIRHEHGAATFVTANNVFAHSDSLRDMADGVRELLADDGVFIFEVSYLVDIIEKKLFDTVYHEHLCYHSVKPLVSFFHRHGLELFDIERLSTKGGSIRGFVQRRNGPRKLMPIVNKLLDMESQMGLDKISLFRKFSADLASVKNSLLSLLQKIQQDGKTIAGYGASATVTTLLYNFELGPYLDFLVDDNQSRHHYYSPGLHLQVLPSSVLYVQKPDYVVVLAWQYKDPIIKKNEKFRNDGGHFIVPLPEVQMI